MVSPRQVKRPAARCREIDDGRPGTPGNRASRCLSRTGELRLDLQRRTESPGHPKNLVVSVRPGGCGQRVVIRPENRDDVATIAEDIRHRLCRWVEANIRPRRERARCEVGPTCLIRRVRRGRTSRRVACRTRGRRRGRRPTRGAPCRGHRNQEGRDNNPPHAPRLCPSSDPDQPTAGEFKGKRITPEGQPVPGAAGLFASV